MTSSLRSALWMLLAANLLGGGAVAFAQAGAPAPAAAPTAPPAPPVPASAAMAPAAATTPPPGLGNRSLIGARCKDDIAKHCPSVAAGGGRLAACLRAHEAELSEACKGALPPGRAGGARPAAVPQAAGAAAAAPAPGAAPAARPMAAGKAWGPMRGMHRACGADAAKLCKDVAPGNGRVAACLNEHAGELSPACKPVAQHIAARMNEQMSMHADCAGDAQKLCSDVPAGSGRVGLCLGEHAAELSAGCKKHLDEMKGHFAQHGMGHGHGPGMMGGKGGMMAPKPNPGAAAPSPGAPLPPPVTK